jgi:hypothetical protein
MVTLDQDVTECCLSAFTIDMATLLQENTSLESISIRSWNTIENKAEDYITLVSCLKRNTTLKTLAYLDYERLQLTADEDKHMASLLKKNYTLERHLDIDLENEAGDVTVILQLNEAGRRYLIEDRSSISKGVEVLSKVNNGIYCVFFHLLENPRLCDRRAVELVRAGGWVDESDS